jgi:hypothetical protein
MMIWDGRRERGVESSVFFKPRTIQVLATMIDAVESATDDDALPLVSLFHEFEVHTHGLVLQ